MIDHILTQDANIITTTTDKHGDQKQSASTPVKCKFRYITVVDKNVDREGLSSTEAIFWFSASTSISETSILKHENKYWRVDRLVKARRLADSTVQFLKVFVSPHKL